MISNLKNWSLILLLGLLTIFSFQRNIIWQTEISLWKDVVKKSPSKPRPNFNLGLALINAENYEESVKYLKRTLTLYPDYHKAKYYLAEAYFRTGRYEYSLKLLLDIEWLYDNVLPFFPEKWEGVSKAFSRADLYNNIASCYYFLKKYKEAERYYRKAIEIKPDHKIAVMGLITLLEDTGRIEEAERLFKKLKLD